MRALQRLLHFATGCVLVFLVCALCASVSYAVNPIAVYPTSPWTLVLKTSDETVNNSAVLQDDDRLTFTLAANTTYVFRAYISFNSPAAADFKYRNNCTGTQEAGTQGMNAIHFFDNAIADEQGSICSSPIDVTVTFTSGAGGAIRMTGVVRQTGTAGVWTLQWAQNTATVGDTIVRRGSWLEWMIVQ